MNVACENCQVNMVIMSTKEHKGRENVETLYRCPGCESCIRVIDNLDKLKQGFRELELHIIAITDELDTLRHEIEE